MLILYYLILLFFSLFSYTLVDPNITLLNNNMWTGFRNYMVYWGYYRRDVTSIIFIILVFLLGLFHYAIVKRYKKYNAVALAGIVGLILLISYPFLSHDFFNYMFDAKILTFYHQNPYLHKALDFPHDPWLRFMHWTHRTYPYGPTFLLISLVPSFLSLGKFIVSYGLFKIVFVASYLVSVYLLNRMNRKWAVFFATNPLILIEGLVNLHNDMIGLALGIIGIYFILEKKTVYGKIILLISAGIKYITTPCVFLSKSNKILNYLAFGGTIMLLGYLSFHDEVQPWYFLAVFGFLPIFENIVEQLSIFLVGILFSYYPYIRFGAWDKPYEVSMKHSIIIGFFVVNFITSLFYLYKIKKMEK